MCTDFQHSKRSRTAVRCNEAEHGFAPGANLGALYWWNRTEVQRNITYFTFQCPRKPPISSVKIAGRVTLLDHLAWDDPNQTFEKRGILRFYSCIWENLRQRNCQVIWSDHLLTISLYVSLKIHFLVIMGWNTHQEHLVQMLESVQNRVTDFNTSNYFTESSILHKG